MSLLKYFKTRSLPTVEETRVTYTATREANEAVKYVLASEENTVATKKRKLYMVEGSWIICMKTY